MNCPGQTVECGIDVVRFGRSILHKCCIAGAGQVHKSHQDIMDRVGQRIPAGLQVGFCHSKCCICIVQRITCCLNRAPMRVNHGQHLMLVLRQAAASTKAS